MPVLTVKKQKTLTQEQWDNYKNQFPDNEKIQAVTLDELMKQTDGGVVDWINPPISEEAREKVEVSVAITDCQLWIGYVIFDAICLAVGGVALRDGLNRETAEAVADAAKPVLSKLEKTIAKMSAEGASKKDLAWGVFEILKTIWSGQCLGAVVSAFVGSLTWYYAALYGATAMATIVAALATDGVAFVAEVAIELATFGFLTADSVNCAKACS